MASEEDESSHGSPVAGEHLQEFLRRASNPFDQDDALSVSAAAAPVPDGLSDSGDETAVVVNTFALAAGLRIPPAFQVRALGESKGPSMRVNHSMVSYEGTLYIYGGRAPGSAQYYAAVSRYVPSRLCWVDLDSKGNLPMRRGDHTAVVVEDKMFVYGGRKQSLIMDDLYAFDFLLNSWEKVTFESGGSPGPVFNHSAAYCESTKMMYVVGGIHVSSSRRHLVFAFDVRGHYWKPIAGPPTVDASELHHCVSSVDEVGGKLIIIGVNEDPTLSAMYLEALHSANDEGGGDRMTSERYDVAPDGSRYSLAMDGGGGGGSGSVVSIVGRGNANKMTKVAETSFTMMLMMDVHTMIWKRIRTEIGPDTPIPFSMEHVAAAILGNISKQPHAACNTKRLWYFPVNLRDLDNTLQATLVGGKPLPGTAGPSKPNAKRRGLYQRTTAGSKNKEDKANTPATPHWMMTFGFEYGVFMYSFNDQTWSLAPLMLPKKRAPLPGEADDAPNKELYSLLNTTSFEGKYAMVTHVVKSSGGLRQLLVLHGGTTAADYSFTLLTPSLPPKQKVNQSNQDGKQGMQANWSDNVDAENNEDEQAQKPTFPFDDDNLSSSQRSPLLTSNLPTFDGALSIRGGLPPRMSTVQAVKPKGMRSGKKKDANSVPVQVVVPLHPSTGAGQGAQHMGMQPTPFVVLDGAERVQQWVHQYYKDECKWMTEQRSIMEKQVAQAKRIALKNAAKDKKKKDNLNTNIDKNNAGSFSLAIPALDKFSKQASTLGNQQTNRKRPAAEVREERVRMGAVVGTLLFDCVDLHPDVQPVKPSSPNRKTGSRRKSSFTWGRRQTSVTDDTARLGSEPFSPRSDDKTEVQGEQQQSPTAVAPSPQSRMSREASASVTTGMSIPNAVALVMGDLSVTKAVTEASRIARIHWAMLRRYVLSGEAARVLSTVEEQKCPDISWWLPQPISSASQLVLNPVLSTFQIVKGTDGSNENKRLISRVPTKPVPYNVGNPPLTSLNARVVGNGSVTYRLRKS